jgi:hypothetical protein
VQKIVTYESQITEQNLSPGDIQVCLISKVRV